MYTKELIQKMLTQEGFCTDKLAFAHHIPDTEHISKFSDLQSVWRSVTVNRINMLTWEQIVSRMNNN